MKIILILAIISSLAWGSTLTDFQQKTRRQELIMDGEAQKINQPTIAIESLPKAINNAPIPTQLNTTTPENIHVIGNTILTPFEIHYICEAYKNIPLNRSDIFKLISTLQNAYANKGYTTTRITIKPTSNASNTLTLWVNEGRIGRFYTKENTWVDSMRLWQLFPVQHNGLFNDFDIRHGIRQAQQLANVQIKTELEPGFETGKTNVLTTMTRGKPWSLAASFNSAGANHFVPTYWQITGHDFFHAFDQWQLSYAHAVQDYYNSTSITLKASLPFRRHLISASITDLISNQYTQTFNDSHDVLQTINKKISIRDTITLQTSNERTLTITPSLSIKRKKTSQNSVFLTSQTNPQTLVGLSSTLTLNHPIRVTSTLGIEQTTHWFHGQFDDPNIDMDSEHVEFQKISGSLQLAGTYALPIIHTTATTLSLSGQSINKITQTSEQAMLGGWYSVKGFNATPMFGEHMLVMNSEQMLPLSQYQWLPKWVSQKNIQIKGFLDAGIIKRRYQLPVSSELNGTGYAMGFGIGIGFLLFNGQFDLKFAKGLKSNASIPAMETLWSWGIGM